MIPYRRRSRTCKVLTRLGVVVVRVASEVRPGYPPEKAVMLTPIGPKQDPDTAKHIAKIRIVEAEAKEGRSSILDRPARPWRRDGESRHRPRSRLW